MSPGLGPAGDTDKMPPGLGPDSFQKSYSGELSFCVGARAQPLRDPAHEVACVCGLVLDVVVRHAAAAVSAELPPVVVLGKQGRFVKLTVLKYTSRQPSPGSPGRCRRTRGTRRPAPSRGRARVWPRPRRPRAPGARGWAG